MTQPPIRPMLQPRAGADGAPREKLELRLTGHVTAALLAGFGWMAVAGDRASDDRVDAAVEQARKASDELAGSLRQLLLSHLAQGGPEAAVRGCAQGAQAAASEFRRRTGVDARRVSLRWRNGADVPDAVEQRLLAELERRAREGAPAGAVHEVVAEDGREVLRYLQPLVTAPMCLACHGREGDIPPAVRDALRELYPQDHATGHAVGDLRGAISVRIPLSAR